MGDQQGPGDDMWKKIGWVAGIALLWSGCGSDGEFGELRLGDDPMDQDPSATKCGESDSDTVGLDTEERRFLELLNQHRASNGRDPVVACTSLNRAAQLHSEDMRDRNYFDHDGLDGSSPGSRSCAACFENCNSVGFGENIAAGNSDAERTFDQWVNSSGHNQNMLRESYVVVGLGRATGGDRFGTYWTNVFATGSDASCD